MHHTRRVLKTSVMFRGVLRALPTQGRASMRRVLAQATISLLCVTALLAPVRSEAITINVVEAGFQFQQLTRERGPQTQRGPFAYTTLLSLGSAAADYWETLLVGDESFRIELGFTTLSSQALGVAAIGGFAMALDRTDPWFVDPTPFDNSEYGSQDLAFADLGGGMLNTGISYFDATGAAATGYDAFTVLLHEIGHILAGLGVFERDLNQPAPSLLINDPLPFTGSVVPLTPNNHRSGGGHIRLGDPLMSGFGTSPGERVLPSDLDILYVAQSGRFTGVNLNRFAAVPEPATLLLFLVGLVMMRYIGTRPFRIPQRSTFTHIAR